MFLNLETRMWLAAGCCYSEAGKKERNLLGKVLTAEDKTKVKSSLWLSKRCGRGKPNIDQELSTVGQGSGTSAGAAGLVRGWVLPVCVSGKGSPWRGAWNGGSKKVIAVCVFISVAESQSRWLLCSFCLDLGVVLFVALLSEELSTLLWMKLG